MNEKIDFDKAEIKKYFAPTATEKEFHFFYNVIKTCNLNPYRREVHFVKAEGKPAQVVVGYEIYLKRAERTKLLDGWKIDIGGKPGFETALITIYRKDRKYPLLWEVNRNEFDKEIYLWKRMPLFMLKKIAIAQGFRLAFPEELGGMPYTDEELKTIENVNTDEDPKQTPKIINWDAPIKNSQKQILFSMMQTEELSTIESKKFYEWRLNGGIETENWAQDFIDNFGKYIAEFLDFETKRDRNTDEKQTNN